MAAEAFFLPVADSQRFCLYYPAESATVKGAVLYLHPFAEEMNKARRMAALQARLLAKHGYAVLQIDLQGCGDSADDFGDATWQSWLQDVQAAHTWLRKRSQAPLWLWGLRAGSLVAVQAAALLDEPANFLFWQPIPSGKQYLQQFLRLKMAGELLSGHNKGVMDALKSRLSAGESVEIAGYTLSADLAHGLESAELAPPSRRGQVIWIELSSRPNASLAPASTKCIEHWHAPGQTLDARVVNGPSFWQTTEIEEAPALLEATLAALEAAIP